MVQKRSVKAPEGAEVRLSTDRLTCEVADQGQTRPISTAMRKTKPKRGRAEEGSVDRTRVLGRDRKGSAILHWRQILWEESEDGELDQ